MKDVGPLVGQAVCAVSAEARRAVEVAIEVEQVLLKAERLGLDANELNRRAMKRYQESGDTRLSLAGAVEDEYLAMSADLLDA